jgi:GNAT superfamily N-acetyltransferase
VSGPTYRPLTAGDIFGAQRLRELAKWNQTARDWENLLTFDASGCFAAEMDGRLVGTATTTRFAPRCGPGSLAWIGMVLVDPESRRHGIGSTLLKNCIAHLQAAGVETIKLDATPMGRPVYEKLNFVAEYSLERWEGKARSLPPPWLEGVKLAPIAERDLAELIRYDTPVFGCDRGAVLSAFWKTEPHVAVLARKGEHLAGYALSRPGSHFHQIGPVVADSPAISEALLVELLRKLDGRAVITDLLTSNPATTPVGQRCGLISQRPFLRMALGPNKSPGQPEKILAICCPELG